MNRKLVLKMTVGTVLICSFILALMYPVISARYMGKIHFLLSPKPYAVFSNPSGKEDNNIVLDIMFVQVVVVKDSTYGSFTEAIVGYETYYSDRDLNHEYHYYTDNLRAGEIFAILGERAEPVGTGMYDVSIARIDVTMSEHQLNATVIVRGKTLFTAGFWADTSTPIQSRVRTASEPLSPEHFLQVEAYRPTLRALINGLEIGDFLGQYSRFSYIATSLFDSSLLP